MRIGLDVMGGDFAPRETSLGAILAHKELSPDNQVVLIGNKNLIVPLLEKEGLKEIDFEIVHTEEFVGMGEHPTKAFAQKPNSSIAIGFRMLKEGTIDAFASAGNSGAMLVGAMYTVKTIPGIIRPSIPSVLPKEDGSTNVLLDVGINADCKPDVLYQFGILGSIFAESVYNIKTPRVGLLNIGEEEEKGNLTTLAAYQLMKNASHYNFIGNVEGRDLFEDKADVIVCDGFTGNVVLKEGEAFYAMIKKRGIKDPYFDRFNFEQYGGVPILGINAPVVIGHGISNANTIKNMVFLAKAIAEAGVSDKIKQVLN